MLVVRLSAILTGRFVPGFPWLHVFLVWFPIRPDMGPWKTVVSTRETPYDKTLTKEECFRRPTHGHST